MIVEMILHIIIMLCFISIPIIIFANDILNYIYKEGDNEC